jgi:hypothetical protein
MLVIVAQSFQLFIAVNHNRIFRLCLKHDLDRYGWNRHGCGCDGGGQSGGNCASGEFIPMGINSCLKVNS